MTSGPPSAAGGVRRFLLAHKRLTGAGAVAAAAVVVFVAAWFQPQKLFIDDRVDEALPTARSDTGERDRALSAGDGRPRERRGGKPYSEPAGRAETKAQPSDPPGGGEASGRARPEVVAAGTFRSLEHSTSGRAVLLRLSDGRRFLRFEDFGTSNGPDLRVYLSEIAAGDDWFAYGERYVDLGALKGNIGDQNYAIPPDVDLSRYKSAVVWCRRFSVGFGVAGLAVRDA